MMEGRIRANSRASCVLFRCLAVYSGRRFVEDIELRGTHTSGHDAQLEAARFVFKGTQENVKHIHGTQQDETSMPRGSLPPDPCVLLSGLCGENWALWPKWAS